MFNSRRKALTVVLVAALAATPSAASAIDLRPVGSEPKVDGREVFKGVHFAVGDVYDSVPELQGVYADVNTGAAAEEAEAFAEQVIDFIEEEAPGFFEEYETQLASGNPVVVEDAIESGDEQLRVALAALAPGALTESSPAACTFGVLVCGLTIVVAVNYGAAVNIAVGAVVYLALWGPSKTWSPFSENGSRLHRDIVIGSLTDHLADGRTGLTPGPGKRVPGALR